jgi:lipoate-protein ligase A
MLFAEWRLILTGASNAYVNMAIDEATVTLMAEHRVPPSVRIYYYDAPCYTVGYLQPVSKLQVISRRRAGGYVRRLTGGQCCAHGGDLAYSLVVSLSDTLIPSNVLDSYERISYGVIEGLRLLGVDARFAPPTDVWVDKWSVATAAQARRQGVLLHQGMIALGPSGAKRETLLPCVTTTPLSELIGTQIDFEDAARALSMGFRSALGVDLSPGILFAKEKRLARQLLRDKYMQASWNALR